MDTKYQIILLGEKNSFEKDILEVMYNHVNELGLKSESIVVINDTNFGDLYKANAPSFCLYFGEDVNTAKNIDLVQILLNNSKLILPVVKNLKEFNKSIPKMLGNINGFELVSSNHVEQLVAIILEGLSLLRLSRRLFISYKRDESTTVAIQLFEELEKNGFDVFLDTHSIRPSESFQDELWHRMADTDVVVLLNTPGFLKSNWTTEELAKANSMSIGILQLIWPTHKLERDAELSIPHQLSDSDFGNMLYADSKSYLTDSAINNVVGLTESLRARSLASRQDNIIAEFLTSAKKVGKTVSLQPEKFILLEMPTGKELLIIPTVGVPQAFTYHQSEDLVARIKSKNIESVLLLYDHRNIRERWLSHLSWLDNYLPIKTIKIVEVEKWLESL